jgi:long-chain acyl-CoA synthetase
MLPHRSLVATAVGVRAVLGDKETLTPADSHISFLPLAHSMERAAQCLFYHYGVQIGFSRGDPKLLIEDIQALQPTIFVGVPRLFAKVYDKVMVGVSSSFVKSTLLKAGMWWKGKDVDRGVLRQDTLFDGIVFKKIRALFGGRVRIVVTGSAPIPYEVIRFLRIALGCPIYEGYGMTETCTCGTFTLPGEIDAGHVGPPVATMAIKLVDVEELKYFSKDDEGEICFKGPGNFLGYYKNEEKTAETIDKDGWVHSGDIGKWLPKGALQIIDRKKQIFKTQQGEYIAPERIENIYRKSLFVEQVFLFGNSLKPSVVSVVVPDEEYLLNWARAHGIEGDMEAVCANKEVNKTILDEMTRIGKESGLKSFEQAKAIHIHPTPFTIEEGLLTPTQKLVRRNLEKTFAQQFEELYAGLDQLSRL